MNKQIEVAVCPTCHGTGCIGTTDWLTRGVDKEKIAKEREEALAEYEAQKKRDAAREIFEEIESKIAENDAVFERCASRLVSSDYANGRSEVVGEILHFLAELKKKYESEGEE
jgi:Zn-finger nucleic acid-binding protein